MTSLSACGAGTRPESSLMAAAILHERTTQAMQPGKLPKDKKMDEIV
jgi:hypothetical protein